MALTNFAALTDEQLTVWKRDVWRAGRNSAFLNRFLGTGENSMIQRITELTESEKGARAVITLVADLEGDGVPGDSQLEGAEEEIKSYDIAIQIDQLRHANRLKGKMADQKSVVRFRENSKNVLGYWIGDRLDQLVFLTLSGEAYSLKNDGTARVGSQLASLDYASDVTAPSTNRYFNWEGASQAAGTLEAGDTAETTMLAPSWNMMLQLKAKAQNSFIKPLRGEMGEELYNVFMTPDGMAMLKRDGEFREAQKDARERGGSNPLFKGATVYPVDGMNIYTFRHVFHPSTWAGSNKKGQAVLLCGSQALGFADIGMPDWVEKKFDYDNQPGISIGKICGLKKPVFRSLVTSTDEDFGVIRVNTLAQ
jgi:N4-gp56 family major capsid protein